MRLLWIFALWATLLQRLVTCDDFTGFSLQKEFYNVLAKKVWHVYYEDYKAERQPVVVAEIRNWLGTLVVLHEVEKNHRKLNKDDALSLDNILAKLWNLKGPKVPPTKLYYMNVNRADIIIAATTAREIQNKKVSSFTIRLENREAWEVMMKSRYGQVAKDFGKHYNKHVSSIEFERRKINDIEDITFYFKYRCQSCGGEHT
ncbi:hypothetical protein CSHISOI_11315 [Colletotrichum shisoi]|uniref:Uncharacterized protein n=1 Tax=Colletotrichum shisoi TaxID=2078593 RepID=A0A5Q4BBA9_9PEZI|nr:hypothetical protein CSHISOI_11315 [Colletotrichum shisoi]